MSVAMNVVKIQTRMPEELRCEGETRDIDIYHDLDLDLDLPCRGLNPGPVLYLMRSGKVIPTKLCESPRDDTAEMTKAAQVDSAKEPKRSAPMPAMSPTLSPTLSTWAGL